MQSASNEEDYARFAGDADRKHVTVRRRLQPTILGRAEAVPVCSMHSTAGNAGSGMNMSAY